MKFGSFEIHAFVEQTFKLDGGAMFGIIPRSIWSKMMPPDENNLILMHNNLFILKAHGKTFLFDAGLGDSLSDKENKIYGISSPSNMSDGLRSIGATEDEIDFVILTHLHTDHAAGAVKLKNGSFIPRFPNAKFIASNKEFEAATNPNERTRAVYIPERYTALMDAGQLELIEGNELLFEGIKCVFTGGHSEGHFALELESDGQQVFYYSDLLSTQFHLGVPYVPATDLYPNQTMDIKREILPRIIENEVTLCFDHDTTMTMGKVRPDGRKFIVDKVN